MTGTVQNHIHMSKNLGTAPENSPDVKWVATYYDQVPVKFMSLRRSLTGKLRVGTVKNAGQTVRLNNYAYKLRLKDDDASTAIAKMDALGALDGELVYFVPHIHCANNTDHTAFVKPMVVSRIEKFSSDHQKLIFFDVVVELEDASW